jgi:hypothetical protein
MKLSTITLIIIIIIFMVFLKLWFVQSNVSTIRLDQPAMKNKYHTKVKLFEKTLANWYPLGTNDQFQIDHGYDYFKFFERIGETHMIAAINKKDIVVAVGCGMLRDINLKYYNKNTKNKVWYIGDVKVHKKYRGQHIPWLLLRDSWPLIFKGARLYGISMNPKDKPNNIVRLGASMPFVPFKVADKLLIFSCDYNEIQRALPIISFNRGSICFVSLLGIKDLILKSTQKPMKLLHLHWGEEKEKSGIIYPNPIKEYVHMFCCPASDPMALQLKNIGIRTDVTATILHYRMDQSDWKFILTSDI